MSAFIVSPRTMARVVQGFVDHAAAGARDVSPDSDGFVPSGDFRAAPGAPAIVAPRAGETEGQYRARLWAALYRMNRAAVRARYGSLRDMMPPDWRTPAPDGGSTLGQRFKSAACLSYQCTEGNVPDSRLFAALAWLEGRIGIALAWRDPDVKSAGWGD